MYKQLLLVLFGSVLSTTSFGQYMKRNGKFTDAVEGTPLFTLADSTFIYTKFVEPLWYEGSARVVFNIDDMAGDSTLPEGAKLYNEDLEIIGEVKNDVRVNEVFPIGGFRKDDYYSAILKGFVASFEFHPNTRPENAVAKALSSRRGTREVVPVLESLPFKMEKQGSYNVWVLEDEDQHNSEAKDYPFRMLVVMRGLSSVVCIISLTEPVESPMQEEITEEYGRYYTWFQRRNDRFEEEMKDIMYRYLPI